MTQYNTLNVKSSNSQINKLKSTRNAARCNNLFRGVFRTQSNIFDKSFCENG